MSDVHLYSIEEEPIISNNQSVDGSYKPFKCKKCGVEFSFSKDLISHRQACRTIQCAFCLELFETQKKMLLHKQIHHSELLHGCTICSKTFQSEAILSQHNREVHAVLKHSKTCNTCGMEIIHSFQQEKCSNCLNAKKQQLSCTVCGKRFKKRSHLIEHQLIHSQSRPYHCKFCGEKFKMEKSLNRHVETVCLKNRNKDVFVCEVCGSKFPTRSELAAHKMNKDKKWDFPRCKSCSKQYSNCHNLKRHIQECHSENKRSVYVCNVCGLTFMRKTNFDDHQKVHVRGRSFVCQICGLNFSCEGKFAKHKKMHECFSQHTTSSMSRLKDLNTAKKAKDAHPCGICGRPFACKASLVIHYRTHTGIKPYSCQECGKCFTDATNLATHERQHNGKLPYQCPKCLQRFRYRIQLIRHLVKHSQFKVLTFKQQVSTCKPRQKHLRISKSRHYARAKLMVPKSKDQSSQSKSQSNLLPKENIQPLHSQFINTTKNPDVSLHIDGKTKNPAMILDVDRVTKNNLISLHIDEKANDLDMSPHIHGETKNHDISLHLDGKPDEKMIDFPKDIHDIAAQEKQQIEMPMTVSHHHPHADTQTLSEMDPENMYNLVKNEHTNYLSHDEEYQRILQDLCQPYQNYEVHVTQPLSGEYQQHQSIEYSSIESKPSFLTEGKQDNFLSECLSLHNDALENESKVMKMDNTNQNIQISSKDLFFSKEQEHQEDCKPSLSSQFNHPCMFEVGSVGDTSFQKQLQMLSPTDCNCLDIAQGNPGLFPTSCQVDLKDVLKTEKTQPNELLDACRLYQRYATLNPSSDLPLRVHVTDNSSHTGDGPGHDLCTAEYVYQDLLNHTTVTTTSMLHPSSVTTSILHPTSTAVTTSLMLQIRSNEDQAHNIPGYQDLSLLASHSLEKQNSCGITPALPQVFENPDHNVLHQITDHNVLHQITDHNVLHQITDHNILHQTTDHNILHQTTDHNVLHQTTDHNILHQTTDHNILHQTTDHNVLHQTTDHNESVVPVSFVSKEQSIATLRRFFVEEIERSGLDVTFNDVVD